MSVWIWLAAWPVVAVVVALLIGRAVRMRERVQDPRDR